MNTRPAPRYAPFILSVRVRSTEAQRVLVVTNNPSLSDAVRSFMQQTDRDTSVVWLTSLEDARRRLAWDTSAMVIVDNFAGDSAPDQAVADLQAVSPNSRILVLMEDAVRF